MVSQANLAPDRGDGRIDYLTPEHERIMVDVRDEWIGRVVSCAPIDEDATRDGVRWIYEILHLPEPRVMIADSPRAAESAVASMSSNDISDEVEANSVISQALGLISNLVRNKVEHNVKDKVTVQVCGHVNDQVWDKIGYNIWRQIAMRGKSLIAKRITFNLLAMDELARIDCWHRFGLPMPDIAERYLSWMRSGPWGSHLFEDTAILVRPAVHLERDDEHRLHSESGAAIRFADGWRLYAWHGRIVPESWALRTEALSETDLGYDNDRLHLLYDRLSDLQEQGVGLSMTPADLLSLRPDLTEEVLEA